MWRRAIFLRYGRKFNAVWRRSDNELVATERIRPGDRICLQPPPAEPAHAAEAPAKAPGGGVRVAMPDREMLRRQYDVERESWCDNITG